MSGDSGVSESRNRDTPNPEKSAPRAADVGRSRRTKTPKSRHIEISKHEAAGARCLETPKYRGRAENDARNGEFLEAIRFRNRASSDHGRLPEIPPSFQEISG